jgi:hypothetical protein
VDNLPYKIIWLDWDVPAPGPEPPEQWYERTYDDVRAKVADLVLAMGNPVGDRTEDP